MPSFKPTVVALALALALGWGPAWASQELTLGSATVSQGQTAALSLSYLGDGSVAGLQLDVTFNPAVVGTPSVSAGTGIGGQVLRSAVVASGRLRLVIDSPINAAVGNGELARLSFGVNSAAPLGPSTLGLTGVVLGNANATSVAPTRLASGTLTVLIPTLNFYTLIPCRLVDTRNPTGPMGGPALPTGAFRSFSLAGACNVPLTARALSINVTVTQPQNPGDLRFFPADVTAPLTSVVNFRPGQTRTNNTIVTLSAAGTFTVKHDGAGTVDLILDVNGYFQ
jgi:hypothetical protein